MHKTYTDCYKMQGFVGGQWAYSLNANHPDGIALSDRHLLDSNDRLLALYVLGWESIDVRLPPEASFEINYLPRDTAASTSKYNCHFRRGDGYITAMVLRWQWCMV